MQLVYLIQVRMGSSRFLGKVLAEVRRGLRIIDLVYERVRRSAYFTEGSAVF